MSFIELLPATTNFKAFTLQTVGNADFDAYVFAKMADSTLSETQALALWTYTDGYSFKLASEYIVSTESVHCLKKTYSVIKGSHVNAGAICFSANAGVVDAVSFYYGLSTTTTSSNLWATEVPDMVPLTTGDYKGLFTQTAASKAFSWSMFMPKWERSDLYQNTFRVNTNDRVELYYKDNSGSVASTWADSTSFKVSSEVIVSTSAR